MSSTRRLRNVTVTLEEEVAQWARIETARRDTSVSRLLGAMLKEHISTQGESAAEAACRLASFGKRNKLSLNGLKIKDLINEGRRTDLKAPDEPLCDRRVGSPDLVLS